jgi:cytochrome P450
MIAAAERTRDRWLAYPPRVEIDVSSEMIRTTFDIIINTLLPARNSIDYALMQKSITDYIGSFSWIVALGMMRAPRWLPFPGIRAARRGRDYLHRALDLLIAEEKRSPGKGSDLLSLLASTTDPETGKSMHDTDVRNNLLGFFAAGHETTAIALTWTFYLLSLHPEVEQRVKREIAGVTGGAPLLPEQVEMLPYTLQVIQEAMRLYPPLPLIGRQARQGARIGNEDVRAGTAVYIPVYAVHRHEAYWREPDEFDPGRFERQAVKALDRYTYLPFGAGPRICIGQTFGELEATAILATLLNSFQLSLRPGYIPEPRYQITLRPRHGMPMRISTPSSRN